MDLARKALMKQVLADRNDAQRMANSMLVLLDAREGNGPLAGEVDPKDINVDDCNEVLTMCAEIGVQPSSDSGADTLATWQYAKSQQSAGWPNLNDSIVSVNPGVRKHVRRS